MDESEKRENDHESNNQIVSAEQKENQDNKFLLKLEKFIKSP